MPPTTQRRHAQGAESRSRILESTLELAAEGGYSGVALALVAQRSGLPASSTYWHFADKDSLVTEAFDHAARASATGTNSQVPEDAVEPMDAVLTTFVRLRDDRAASGDLWRAGVLLGLACSPVRDDVRTAFRAVRAESVESMRSSLASVRASAGLPPAARHVRDVARLQSAAADGLFLATETARPWNVRRLTESVGRALASVALAGDVRRPRTSPLDGIAPRLPPPVDDSRAVLLVAATEIASEFGYAGTTVTLVCGRAGLSPSSLYRHVAGKDALIAAVVEHSFVQWLDAQPTWALATTEGQRVETLQRVGRASIAMSRATPAFLRIGHLVSLEAAADGTAARTQFHRIRRQAENSLTAWFAGTFGASPAFADRELPRTLARVVLVLTDGLFLSDQLGEGPGDDVADLVVEVLETIVRQRKA